MAEITACREAEKTAKEAADAAMRDSMKHRGLLEIATAQADALSLKHEVRLNRELEIFRCFLKIKPDSFITCCLFARISKVAKKEIELLREQQRELAAASNDALIIGKLQQETMAKHLTYMQFARKFKAAMVQLRSKELQNREMMKQLDNVTEELQAVSVYVKPIFVWGLCYRIVCLGCYFRHNNELTFRLPLQINYLLI